MQLPSEIWFIIFNFRRKLILKEHYQYFIKNRNPKTWNIIYLYLHNKISKLEKNNYTPLKKTYPYQRIWYRYYCSNYTNNDRWILTWHKLSVNTYLCWKRGKSHSYCRDFQDNLIQKI